MPKSGSLKLGIRTYCFKTASFSTLSSRRLGWGLERSQFCTIAKPMHWVEFCANIEFEQFFLGVRILHLKFTFACSKWKGGEYVPRDYNSLSAKWYCMDHRSKTPLDSYESTLVKIKIIRIDDTIASIRTECLFRIIPIEVSICIFIQLTRLKRWKWRMACCAFPFIFSDLLSDNVSQELKFFETLPLENERTVSQRIISK